MKQWRFVKKRYGRGRVPSSWQGRLVTVLYVVFLAYRIVQFKQIDEVQHSISDTLLNFFLPLIIATLLLVAICFWKGEKPKRQRGKK